MRVQFAQHQHSGFTLLELLTALAIGLILLVAGVPGFSAYIANQRATSSARELLQDLIIARTEAARSGLSTRLEPIDGAWANGWVVSRDSSPFAEAAQEILESYAASDANVQFAVCALDPDDDATQITFARMGELAQPGGGVRVVLSAKVGNAGSYREVLIQPTGRAETTRLTESAASAGCG